MKKGNKKVSESHSEEENYSHKKNILLGVISVIIGIMILIGAVYFYGFGFIQEIRNTPKVLASVNGQEITQEELKEMKRSINLSATGDNISEEDILEEMIVTELLYQEAQKNNYNYTFEEIEEMLINQLAMQGMTLDDFKEQIASQNLSYEEQIKKYQKQIAIQNYLDEEIDESEFRVTEQEARDYYNDYIEQNPELTENQEIHEFDDVKEQVIAMLEEQKRQEVAQKLIQELREDATIEYY